MNIGNLGNLGNILTILAVALLVSYLGGTLSKWWERRREKRVILSLFYGLPTEIKLILAYYNTKKAHTLSLITNDIRLLALRHLDILEICGLSGDGAHAYFSVVHKMRSLIPVWARTDPVYPRLAEQIEKDEKCLPL
jgi:hypothetical protein